MTVQVCRRPGAPYKTMSSLHCDPTFESVEVHKFLPSNLDNRPVVIRQHGDEPPKKRFQTFSMSRQDFDDNFDNEEEEDLEPQSLMHHSTNEINSAADFLSQHSAFGGGENGGISAVDREETTTGSDLFPVSGGDRAEVTDPATGAVRFMCR